MTEKEIQLLGFTKQEFSDGSYQNLNGEWVPDLIDYYYSLDICSGMSFITRCKSEISEDAWYVDVFNTEFPIRFYDSSIVKSLIDQLIAALIKS
jgi:hypothetical protein